MKLQEAFVSEANAVGDWDRIGYKMADTPNFDYEPVTDAADEGTTLLSALTTKTQYWSAKNKVAMNDCPAGTDACEWKLELESADGGNGIKVSATAGDKMLTPSFEMIGK